MQRKTNLFYVKDQDSNFLTFSNYTEALTGNFLSTDWKVYPSRFLCIYAPSLETDESRREFIKNQLVSYYENKLAFLRDYYTQKLNSDGVTEFDIEADINALAWLFHTIFMFDPEAKINFIGEVTEFDYKGTYTDTICIIDASEGYKTDTNKLKTYSVSVDSGKNIIYSEDGETILDKNILYNWTYGELQGTEYENVPVTLDNDDDNTYAIYSEYDLTTDTTDDDYIRFNIIVPLFDITNIYAVSNFNTVEESFTKEENLEFKNYVYDPETDEITLKSDIDSSEPKEIRSINNPMGIWFSDEVIELKRDRESKYAPSWSLTISSQFKPFPYSGQYLNNDITQEDNQQAFATYAQVLARQSTLNVELSSLSSRVTKLEQIVERLNSLDTKSLRQKLSEYENIFKDVQKTLETFKDLDNIIETKIKEILDERYRWKN